MKSFVQKTAIAIKSLALRRIKLQFDGIEYEYRKVPARKMWNWLLTEISADFQTATIMTRPTHLQVEPASICNLECSFCPVTTGMDRETGLMELETFRAALGEFSDSLLLVQFWDWGEPFLNPGIFEMISEAKKHDIRVVSSTNGHVFKNPRKAQQLVESGIDTIIFAVDGLRQETYQEYRQGGELEQVITGMKNVVNARKAQGTGLPLINLRFLAMKHNEHEIRDLEAFADKLGVDAVSVKTVNPYDGDGCATDETNGLEFVPENPALQRFEYDQDSGKRIRLARNPCKRLWNNPAVHWDGKISPCAFDPGDAYTIGDLKEQSFREIWFGEKAGRLRRKFSDNYREIPICSNCTYAFKGGACSTDTIANVKFLDSDRNAGSETA